MKNRLSKLRAEQRMSQEDLAQKIHYSQQLISRYEKGNISKVDVKFENSICEFFNCSLDYLRYRSNIKNEEKYSETLKKVSKLITEFYSDEKNVNEKQDLSDEELDYFLEIISHFKDLLQKFPK